MDDMKRRVSDLCDLKDKLVCGAKEAMNNGLASVDTHEMGEVTDMIKDLAEAEEKCWKALYYKSIVEAMQEDPEEMGPDGYPMGRRGYDHWRYSSGKFAPAGHGHYSRAGFMPMEMMDDPWMMAEEYGDVERDRMMGRPGADRGGYSNSSRNGQNGSSDGSGMGANGRMGYHGSERGHRYDRWNEARMGYRQSKDAAHKEHMDASAREYVVDLAESVKEVWKDADPAMKKEIKNKLVALTGEMN